MTAMHYFLAVIITLTMTTGILLVLFGQITVRKLRKNPKTKDLLGLEIISGWDIINVAHALWMPDFLCEFFDKIKRNKNKEFSNVINGDRVLILQHTNRFDRFLGSSFHIVFNLTGLLLFILIGLDWLHGD